MLLRHDKAAMPQSSPSMRDRQTPRSEELIRSPKHGQRQAAYPHIHSVENRVIPGGSNDNPLQVKKPIPSWLTGGLCMVLLGISSLCSDLGPSSQTLRSSKCTQHRYLRDHAYRYMYLLLGKKWLLPAKMQARANRDQH